MIEIKNVNKSFGKIEAVKNTTLLIHSGSVFGMLGTNGAGKSTLLRMMAGILQPDKGEVLIDGRSVWDDPKMKKRCFYISDEQFFFPNATAKDMAGFYRKYYPEFDMREFEELLERFGLEKDRKIQTFSKGMKKQLSIIFGLSTKATHLLCDETFDGLDPVMRQGIKSIFMKEMDERNLTPIIASHNLRELEDICDHIGLLHKGGVLLSKELTELKCNLYKLQCVFAEDGEVSFYKEFDILQLKQRGKFISMTVRGKKEEIDKKMQALHPVYFEILPLSLEEIFISETEVVGYDIKNLIF